MTSSRCRFVLLEPSKVGSQHITLLSGYLAALKRLSVDSRGLALTYRADNSSFAALPADVRAGLPHEAIDVLDVEKRRWVRKIFQELSLTLGTVAKLGAGDVLLVTCVSSPTLFLLELLSPLFRRAHVVVLVHGEMEALFDANLRGFGSWGGWAFAWSRIRRARSRLRIAVIASFIATALVERHPERLQRDRICVLPHPIVPVDVASSDGACLRVVFIGYRTRLKGFPVFERLSRTFSDDSGYDFIAVGAGFSESLTTGTRSRLASSKEYLAEISTAAVAVFPYEAGYNASLSAAALDALATGVHIVATRRSCFIALQQEFGEDAVTLFDSEAHLSEFLRQSDRLRHLRARQRERIRRIEGSPYGLPSVVNAFGHMLDALGLAAERPSTTQRLQL